MKLLGLLFQGEERWLFLTLTFISSQHRKKWWWGEQHDYTYLSPMMVEGSVYSARKRKTPLPFRIAALGPTI